MPSENAVTHVTLNFATAVLLLLGIGLLAALTVLGGTLSTPVFLASYGVADLIFSVVWYRRLFSLTPLACRRLHRWVVGLTLPVCLVFMLTVLRTWADPEVRSSPAYQLGFLIAWGAALLWAHLVGWLLGLGWLEQGLERGNPGAVWAGVGLTVGTTLAVAGANIGEGETMATTIGPMFLAVGALLGLWGLFTAMTGNTATVTVERDNAAGLRLGSVLVAWGLVLGRSVAGDWVSVEATLRDFLYQGLLPGLGLLGLAVVIEFLTRPTRLRPLPALLEIVPLLG